MAIQMQAEPTVCAGYLGAFLLQGVAGMAAMWKNVLLIQTWTLNKGLEGLFIAAFVHIASTSYTSHVARGFFQLMPLWWRCLCLLLLQNLLDDLLSSHLLGHGLMWAGWLWHGFLNAELWAVLLESSMMRGCPWSCALCNQLFFVLLCLFALVPVGFLVYIVLFVVVDLGQPGNCMGVDELVVFIKHLLPFLLPAIL